MQLRVLPLVIIFAFTSVVVKLFDYGLYKANVPSGEVIAKFEAMAQEGEAPAAEAEAEASAEGEGESPAEEEKSEDAPEEEEAHLSPGYSGAGPSELDITNMSDMERSLLENLAKRRKELETWSASIAMKENILNASEKKINRKMEELSALKTEVSNLLLEYNKKENKQILRLVKIYENMKPQDAASIFERMDDDILLEVVDNMKEAKAAKILAKLNSDRANQITSKLAQKRRLGEAEQ